MWKTHEDRICHSVVVLDVNLWLVIVVVVPAVFPFFVVAVAVFVVEHLEEELWSFLLLFLILRSLL